MTTVTWKLVYSVENAVTDLKLDIETTSDTSVSSADI